MDSGPAAFDSLGNTGDDLSALAWVHGELRRSLEAAHKSLRRYLKDAEGVAGGDLDTVDPSVLRSARTQLHQGVGALELVGMPALADVLRASESAVQRLVSKPALVDVAAVETIEKVSFALLDYLARHLARKPVSPVMLFPQYRAALQLAAADRVHPADLWKVDFQWRDLPHDPRAKARGADDEARSAMETGVLALMRDNSAGPLLHMSDLCADLAAGVRSFGATGQGLATVWQLAAAVFQAQAAGLLGTDVYTKRVASRLLAQLRGSSKGGAEASDRLAKDLLFFCAAAREPQNPEQAPRLSAVRALWRLGEQPVADYETPRLGRFDPSQLLLARKRVAAAKDSWSAVAGGEEHRIANLPEQFALVGESIQRLFPGGEVLAASLQATIGQTVQSGRAPPAPLAMEVATGILYLDASLEDGELDQPELAQRVKALAARIDDVRAGNDPQPLDAWMEELYRRVSDRQTMGSVVAELRASLSEVEKHIDQYFRDPAERQVLIPVPAQLSSMRGVLSVLGMDQASQAALHMRDAVDELAQTEVDPQRAIQTGTFDRLADNLGALSFLIDMLSVQPQLAKSLFRFDPETGVLSAVMGKTERVSAFAQLDEPTASAPAPLGGPSATLLEQVQALGNAARSQVPDSVLARDAERLAQQALAADERELARLLSTAHAGLREGNDAATRAAMRTELAAVVNALQPAPEPAPAPAPVPAPTAAPAGGTGLEDDAEMREIFIEEAREVVTDATAAVERLQSAPDSAQDMTAVRRAFHTLKGSSRMVGLRDFGEAAWSCEQLFNARLASAPHMDVSLRQVTSQALAYLGGWVEAIASGHNQGHTSAEVARAADALRLDEKLLPITPPQPEAATVSAVGRAPAPVAAEDQLPPPPVSAPVPLETTLILPRRDVAPTPAPAAPAEPLPEVPAEAPPAEAEADFTLTLTEFDEPPTMAVPAPATALVDRVPDLPAAADLDLGATEPMPLEAPVTAPPAEPAFELDLSSFDEPPPPPAPLPDLALDFEAPPVAEALVPPAPPVAEVLPTPEVETFEIDFGDLATTTTPLPVGEAADDDGLDIDLGPAEPVEAVPPQPEPLPVAEQAREPQPEPAEETDEQVKVIGPLRISIPLFNIYLNEADELSRRLVGELGEWALEHERQPVSETAVALAHSLAGSSATVGYADLSALARALEHALMRSQAAGRGRPGEAALFAEVAEDIRRLLHQFAAGFLRPVAEGLMERLAEHERLPVELTETLPEPEPEAQPEPAVAVLHEPAPVAEPDDIDAVDAIDAELFPIFEEEADELLPQLQGRLREWHDHPGNPGAPAACMRTLHTFKGGARLAGAMRLGEMAHRLETLVEHLSAQDTIQAAEVEPLMARADAMAYAYDALRHRGSAPAEVAAPAPPPVAPEPPALQAVLEPLQPIALPVLDAEPAPEPAPLAPEPVAQLETTLPVEPPAVPATEAAPEPVAAEAPLDIDIPPPPAPAPGHAPGIDWARFLTTPALAETPAAERAAAPGSGAVRVRSGLLDRLVNIAGEVSITRSRIDATVQQLQGSLGELTESLERMRRQLRDIELQAETQISSRMEAAKAAAQTFDPLEMDRFTRFQELTRFMAESVNDVATLQRSLQRTLQSAEDELAAQARLTRELQDDLLRTRMVEFESLADRLYRTVRQAAKETAKQVRLDIVGGGIEIDRGVLERMAGSFEHLLRNSVAHGIELAVEREQLGKEPAGLITVTVAQSGNEVAIEVADDGAGLDLPRIRARAIERGLIAPDAQLSDADLAQLIFAPGFSTAETVTELAGRGVGMDVVRSEVNAMGGRIETQTERGRGSRFRLLLPLTTAVTQVVMLRCGDVQVAVPSPLIEVVKRVPSAEVEAAYGSGELNVGGTALPFFWLASLLQLGQRGGTTGRSQSVVIVRSAAQRVAVHVDEVVGNQEVVVKNVGPQLARLPGLAGVTLLPSGTVALIYNPVALAAVYAGQARALADAAAASGVPLQAGPATPAEPQAPMVLVVDDSLTVRRVTQRLLVREGYRVVLAKDGLDALERLAEERPAVLLSDIEMPRMDGFDLVRNVRSDARMGGLPVIMITSRIAQKHRDYAAELGVDHYLGKPYAEDELLALIAGYVKAAVPG
jgi:chemosensory pili system protein ChpA (sensor histidine kinase/response regulator)